MNRILLPVLLFLWSGASLIAQKNEIITFLEENSTTVDLDQAVLKFDADFYSNQLFFFGFIHGSETPQLLDLELLKTLSKKGVRIYAPEVDYSLAYFFNQYVITGDEKMLDFACRYYVNRVSQDASIQFKNKWKGIYAYNQTLAADQRISIVGFDQEYSSELTLTHLAYIAPKDPTGVSTVDSLRYFRNLEVRDINIISGKPVYKSGKSWDYFFSTEKIRFYKKFIAEYKKDSSKFNKAFGENSAALRHLMSQRKTYNREAIIYENFKKIGLTKIEKGEKIYSNYGYFHVQQEKVNGASPLAKLIKDSCEIKMVSILGLLRDSECMLRKTKADGPLFIKDTRFKKSKYSGYKASTTYDGDSFFERVNGINLLKEVSKGNNTTLFKLVGEKSPLNNRLLFANFSRGGRKWKVEKDASTTDYFQYVFLIQNSKTNIPLEEEEVTH